MRLTIAAAALLAVSTQADAQIASRHPPRSDRLPSIFDLDKGMKGPTIDRELRDVRDRIDDARSGDGLSRSEARQLRREANAIGAAAYRYPKGGMSASEQRELETRLLVLRSQLAVRRARPDASKR